MDTIELSNKLRQLSKKIDSVKALIISNPSLTEHFVTNARTNEELQSLTDQQTEVAQALLKHEQAAEERKKANISAGRVKGKKAGQELLERLSAFAEKLSVAFSALSSEYSELLELSAEVGKVNSMLSNANLPECIHASVRISPRSLNILIKEQFRESFGANATDVYLPQKIQNYDIVDAVKQIHSACQAEEEAKHGA